VLAASGFMLFVEFFADKIPYVDSVWDAVHTVIRIPAGAALAAGALGADSSAMGWVGALVGGSLAATSHATKMTTRAAINTSPEPFSNFVMSTAEDLGVAGILTFAMFHPEAAAIIAGVLLLAGLLALFFLISRIRRFLRRRAQRREEKRLAARVGQPPD
jgi:hypothetical protein